MSENQNDDRFTPWERCRVGTTVTWRGRVGRVVGAWYWFRAVQFLDKSVRTAHVRECFEIAD